MPADRLSRLAAALADRYRMDRELGTGGMATVYLAEDRKHRRQVAIKVLHAELSALLGPERFLNEIELTAGLQHPHILPLFDSGSADGQLYYVMPFVEGETLRGMLQREGQLPVADALRITGEVADALSYAHGKGVVHRDIKPENILLQNGHALVADFGIALAVQQAGGVRMTQTGLSLGTPQYMSPEQAMGEREITARSDIYSLGAVSYEMLAGEPPFTGPNAQAIVARVLTEEPRSLTSLRRSVADHVDAAITAALEKLPADRPVSAAAFASALSDESAPFRTRHGAAATSARAPAWARALRWAWIPAAAAGLAAGILLRGAPLPDATPLRSSLLPPPGCEFADVEPGSIQLSPDAQLLAFLAACDSAMAIHVRALATGATRALPGTDGAIYPFWSPDNASLGFFADGKLKRIDLATGAIRVLAVAPHGRGGAWSGADGGVIVFAPDVYGPLYRVTASGGTATIATTATVDSGVTQRLPYFFPDGRHYLFVEGPGALEWEGSTKLGTLGSSETRKVLDVPSNVAFASGYLFYVQNNALFAQPFSLRDFAVTGAAVAIAPFIESNAYRLIGNFAIAGDVAMFISPVGVERRVEWFDPTTRSQSTALEPGLYHQINLSPDGRRVLIQRSAPDDLLNDVWLYDFPTTSWSRLTSHPDIYYDVAWLPDGSSAALSAADDSTTRLITPDHREVGRYVQSRPVTRLIATWAPGGAYAVGDRQVAATGFDLIRFDPGTGKVVPMLVGPGDQTGATISPDGRALAYVSDRTGRSEVYVTTLPDALAEQPVSKSGIGIFTTNSFPLVWSQDGRTLYFADPGGQLMSASVMGTPPLRLREARPVPGAPSGVVGIDATPDGRLLLLLDDSRLAVPATLIANWQALVTAR